MWTIYFAVKKQRKLWNVVKYQDLNYDINNLNLPIKINVSGVEYSLRLTSKQRFVIKWWGKQYWIQNHPIEGGTLFATFTDVIVTTGFSVANYYQIERNTYQQELLKTIKEKDVQLKTSVQNIVVIEEDTLYVRY